MIAWSYWFSRLSPSNFNATNGDANEWNQNSAGYLNNWWGVNNSLGARPDSY